jgi:hypothetical protein
MEYSAYNPREFQTDNIQRIKEAFLQFAKDDETKSKIAGVLENGGFNDYSVNEYSKLMNRDNPKIETIRRIGMAFLISQYPETFNYLSKNKIGLFHGTSSLALPKILSGGLKSFGKIKADGEQVISGEKSTMKYREAHHSDNFVSVSDNMETIFDYSLFDNNKKFGVIIGINQEALKQLKTVAVDSYVPEIRN